IAHDFNNLLTTMMGHLDPLLVALPTQSVLHDSAEQVMKAASRAAGLTYQLLAFSRRQVLQPRVVELNALVRDFLNLLTRVLGEDVVLNTRLTPQPTHTEADPGQLEQVLMNLVLNARDAMPN